MEGTWVTNNCDKLLHKSLNHFGFRPCTPCTFYKSPGVLNWLPANPLSGLSEPTMSYGFDAEVDSSVVFISSGAESQSQ